jgi:transposase
VGLEYAGRVIDLDAIKQRFSAVRDLLDERSRRLLVATEARALGRGGITAVAQATGVSRAVIRLGLRELNGQWSAEPGRVRRPGGGRKRLADLDPTLVQDLECLVEPTTRGDPETPLRWTCKSLRRLTDELHRMGHEVSYPVVADLLDELGYSLQANRKTKEGADHPDRDAQFQHINARVKQFRRTQQPIISVDTKKKELLGNFKNAGRERRPKGNPERVRVHDFMLPELGRATPYGIYDLTHNCGWVSVGIDHDTGAFAVETIRRWWHLMGHPLYPGAQRLLITADGGGSNGSRLRLWKVELQQLADETGLRIAVCHFPPGTSKWNKIEHRLFSFISQNWRGKPLTSVQVMVSLIAATTTRTGLKVHAEADTSAYPAGIKVSEQEMSTVNLHPDKFHRDWNYEIRPRNGKVIP